MKISSLPRIGEKRAKLFQKIGITNIFDLLYYLPRRYEDRRLRDSLNATEEGPVSVAGVIDSWEEVKLRRNLTLLRVILHGNFGTCTALWFNQSFLKRSLRRGTPLMVTGKVEKTLYGYEISVVDYEIGNCKEPVHVGRLVPVYGTTGELSQRYLRRVIFQLVHKYASRVKDVLSPELRQRFNLYSASEALREIHFPRDAVSLERARERLVFEELFLFEAGLSKIRESLRRDGVARPPRTDLAKAFIKSLPFPLTAAQRRVIAEVERDLLSTRRMYRLVQGDVGCGKTIVAIYALLSVVAAGYQGALMAPTEILAEQHYLGINRIVSPLGVRVGLLTGSLSKKEREQNLAGLRSGEIDIIIGTHALLEREVAFRDLGLIVIDEQHRFGVQQRDLLLSKAASPDVLVMTATPIPRSMTMTVYGDLDVSVIDELPAGRKPVKTYFLPASERSRVYRFVRKELMAGRQAYVVCPLIEESEHLNVEAAVARYEELKEEFAGFRVELLHGRMKIEEKEGIMEAFRKGEIQLLVATSVIEVGIDVPNASVIVIEGVERFGLAQLHQLRGRVGRGSHESYCVLIGAPQTPEARERIKILVKYHDGFQVAEHDLALRGPGELLGTRQHGYSDFRVVDIFRDMPVYKKIKNYFNNCNFNEIEPIVWKEINFRFPNLLQGLKI
ncbi:ATP-dependent DNA helicase RecG [Thermacetogenium phaeum]|uniref:ATP-dependent DNA helicase RecG n=1 Tax=Thermacetogenium phaeum TaxID=85874 RepID=UPI00048E29D9|nr:ATP-dependent DNA helicase RecG [Thermacetogenium phaeum]